MLISLRVSRVLCFKVLHLFLYLKWFCLRSLKISTRVDWLVPDSESRLFKLRPPLSSKMSLGQMVASVEVIQACSSAVFYRGADKSLARPGRKQCTATKDFDVHISYLLS
jgi:hypothetical protein